MHLLTAATGSIDMNQDSNAILTLCSHVCVGEGVRPLEPKEYGELAQKLNKAGKSPKEIFEFSIDDFKGIFGCDEEQRERILRLLDRNASLSISLGEYSKMGINTVTRADAEYPKKLRQKLGNACPPIFYYAGNTDLLDGQYIGYVGSRTVTAEDMEFTKRAIGKTASLGYGVVSGGAQGIDTIAEQEALRNGVPVVAYLADSMMKMLRSSEITRNIQRDRMIMLSVSKPDAGFNVGIAMMRNRYVYAQSNGTVVVRSDLNKGGTWAGANENLRNNWCVTLCWNHPYPGNKALIEKGAVPIDGSWDGTVPEKKVEPVVKEVSVQQSFFDIGI